MNILEQTNDEICVSLSKEEFEEIHRLAGDILEENEEIIDYENACYLTFEALEGIQLRFKKEAVKSNCLIALEKEIGLLLGSSPKELVTLEEIIDNLTDGDVVLIQTGKFNEHNYYQFDLESEESIDWHTTPIKAKVSVERIGKEIYLSFEEEDERYIYSEYTVKVIGDTGLYADYKGNNFFKKEDGFALKVLNWKENNGNEKPIETKQKGKTYQVVITEVRKRIVSLNAYDAEEAVKAIHDEYHEGELELIEEDISEVSFAEL